jgi:hypothetical protein
MEYISAFHAFAFSYTEINKSGYGSGGNDWLRANKNLTFAAFNNQATLNLVDAGNGWFKITASSLLDVSDVNSDTRQIVWWVREKDYFTRYVMFQQNGTLTWGNARVSGDAHCNGSMAFNSYDAMFYGLISAVSGFSGSWRSSMFPGGYNRSMTSIAYPTASSITNVAAKADQTVSASCTVELICNSSTTYNTRILIKNSSSPYAVISDTTLAAGAGKTIYVNGDITSLKGKLNSRVTLACSGKVYITESLVYVDSQGDPAYQNIVGTNRYDYRTANYYTTASYWAEQNYAMNPDYQGNAVLGVMAVKEIDYGQGAAANTNIEMNTAVLVSGGSGYNGWFKADMSQNKQHMRLVGSMVTQNMGGRYSGSSGYPSSGLYIYDQNLMNNPPDDWLDVNSPLFSCVYITK